MTSHLKFLVILVALPLPWFGFVTAQEDASLADDRTSLLRNLRLYLMDRVDKLKAIVEDDYCDEGFINYIHHKVNETIQHAQNSRNLEENMDTIKSAFESYLHVKQETSSSGRLCKEGLYCSEIGICKKLPSLADTLVMHGRALGNNDIDTPDDEQSRKARSSQESKSMSPTGPNPPSSTKGEGIIRNDGTSVCVCSLLSVTSIVGLFIGTFIVK